MLSVAVALLVLAGLVATSSSAAEVAARAAGAPNLALMAVGPTDVSRGKIKRQGYFESSDFTVYYEREFRSGTTVAGAPTLMLESDIGLAESGADARAYVNAARSFVSRKSGRAAFTESVLAGASKELRQSAKVTFGRTMLMDAGDQAFMARMTLSLFGIRVPMIMAFVRVERAVQVITILGSPERAFSLPAISRLARAVAARMESGLAPVNTVLPTIAGVAQVGLPLTAAPGSWTAEPTSYAFQWESCTPGTATCTPIAGATTETYTPSPADVGRSIRVSVTAANAVAPGAVAASAESAPVAAAPATP
jgi:hypothetical protein